MDTGLKKRGGIEDGRGGNVLESTSTRWKLRSTEVGDKRRRKRRGRGDGAKGLLERGLRLGVSRRNLQKYIGAQEGGSNRVSFSAARISTLSSADFTAFSGCLPLYRPELRRKISLLSNYIVVGLHARENLTTTPLTLVCTLVNRRTGGILLFTLVRIENKSLNFDFETAMIKRM